jgi:hypothetical protein
LLNQCGDIKHGRKSLSFVNGSQRDK